MSAPIFEIPVTRLRPGMTVYKEDEKGKLRADVYLADYYIGSYSAREFVQGHCLRFITHTGSKVLWRNAGSVMVSYGNAIR